MGWAVPLGPPRVGRHTNHSAGPDGHVIQMPAGVRERVRLTASYRLRDVTVYDPIAPIPGLERRSFEPGEVLELAGGPWLEPNVGYIIRGQRV